MRRSREAELGVTGLLIDRVWQGIVVLLPDGSVAVTFQATIVPAPSARWIVTCPPSVATTLQRYVVTPFRLTV